MTLNNLPITTLRARNVKRQQWERDKEICDLILSGMPFEQIGGIYGVTRQRIDQIKVKYKLEQKTPEVWEQDKKIADTYLGQEQTIPQIAKKYRVSEEHIQQLIADFGIDLTKPLRVRQKSAVERRANNHA